jgi:translation initiation factor IF-3
MSRQEALDLAFQRDLDLVEISPNANPPVVKVINWGKFNYQRTKQLQKNKRNAKILDVKQIRFGLKISDHDLEIKLKRALTFLETGHKVKFTIFYRGRELAHKEMGFLLADKAIKYYGDKVIIDQTPQLTGKQLNFVARSNHAKTKNP